jgi:acyl transferase domain-containing protein/acyl carrier protein
VNVVEIQAWLVARIAEVTGLHPGTISSTDPFESFGLASRDAVSLAGDLEELLGRTLPASLLYEYPSIAALSNHLGDSADSAPEPSPFLGASTSSHDVAIVGMACRFPGADSPEAFWSVLRNGTDMIREVPPDRWDARAVYDVDPAVPGKSVSRWGGFLDRVDRFDAFFFGISPGEAERMDPQQRILLELAWEAFDDAGYARERLAGSSAGVFVGISVNEYGLLQADWHDRITGHSGTGNALSIAANRISYFLDLRGPSLAIDTACSSSLTAIHLACRSLREGECEIALAGGVNVVLGPAHSIAFTKAGVLAPDGRCKSFDERADGYVRGEGAGLVVLKSLARALADGDTIHAIIRGSAVRQDGRTNGLMAPSRESQVALLEAACRDAGVSPSAIQYVEAHGTGTLLGDAIEAGALGTVLSRGPRAKPCAIGSVKSNIGHLEAAAGVAGLIKVVLALKHRELPASLHFVTPNPHVPFETLGLRVQASAGEWPDPPAARLAGLSSFGFGGTNVHLILSAAPDPDPRTGVVPCETGTRLLPVSAKTPEALAALCRSYRELLASSEVPLSDLCAAAGVRRTHLEERVAFVGDSAFALGEAIDAFLQRAQHPGTIQGPPPSSGHPGPVFVFSGQGGQGAGMGRELHESAPAFRETLVRCDACCARACPGHCSMSSARSIHGAFQPISTSSNRRCSPCKSRRPPCGAPGESSLLLWLGTAWVRWRRPAWQESSLLKRRSTSSLPGADC